MHVRKIEFEGEAFERKRGEGGLPLTLFWKVEKNDRLIPGEKKQTHYARGERIGLAKVNLHGGGAVGGLRKRTNLNECEKNRK